MARENRYCPPEFADVLTEAGGVNQYGEPIFRLVWSGTETMRGGGYWADGYAGYRDILVKNGPQCWMVMQWEEAGTDGSPWLYYFRHRDDASGMCDVGEYSFHGCYRVVRPLMWSGTIGSEFVHEHLELTSFLLEAITANIVAWKQLSADKKRLALMEEQARKEDELNRLVIEARKSCRPAFGAASKVVAAKVEMFERNWHLIAQYARELQARGKGTQQETSYA